MNSQSDETGSYQTEARRNFEKARIALTVAPGPIWKRPAMSLTASGLEFAHLPGGDVRYGSPSGSSR